MGTDTTPPDPGTPSPDDTMARIRQLMDRVRKAVANDNTNGPPRSPQTTGPSPGITVLPISDQE